MARLTAPGEAAPRQPLCALTSLAAGEDPIGTAPHWQEVTVLELDVPVWNQLRQAEHWTDEQQAVFAVLREKVESSGAGFGLLMSAPRQPGGPLRVRHYQQGPGGFVRRDYRSALPQSAWARGLHDTLIDPGRLRTGAVWHEQTPPPGADHHICTHGTVDAACGRFGVPVYQALQSGGRAWRTGHFGGHRFAATAVELPSGLLWAHLTPDLALQIARRAVPPSAVRRHLRGFAGLPPQAQVLDRELLVEHGWDWLNASRTARVNGETVELRYRWQGRRGLATARVRDGVPLRLPVSSHSAELSEVRQFMLDALRADLPDPVGGVRRPLTFLLAAGVLLLALLISLAFGATDIPLDRVARVLLRPDDSTQSLVVHTLRLPRTLVAMLAGAGLAVGGLLMQGVTRNPLADPGLLGVEAGGAFAILTMVVFFPAAPAALFVPAAFLGGLLAASAAYGAARSIGVTPLRLVLAGVAVAYLIGAATRTVQLLFEERAQGALFALSGSLAGRTWDQLRQVTPWMGLGLLLALLLSARLNVLALGEDVARGLGARTERDSAVLTGLGVLLAAASVSVVGPIGFVGLVVPHAARRMIGADHRLSLPLSALLGAALLALADTAARLVDRPAETPVGILVAALGAPFFVLLARQIGTKGTA